jgi:hypothetical protein
MTMNHQNTICMMGTAREKVKPEPFTVSIDCDQKRNKPKKGKEPWTRCMCQQLCAKVKKMEEARQAKAKEGKPLRRVKGARTKPAYGTYKTKYIDEVNAKVAAGENIDDQFVHPCAACEYKRDHAGKNPTEGGDNAPFNADHMHEAGWGCNLKDLTNFKMLNKRVNGTVKFGKYKPQSTNKDQPIQCMGTCNCPNGPPEHDPGDPSCSKTNEDGTPMAS